MMPIHAAMPVSATAAQARLQSPPADSNRDSAQAQFQQKFDEVLGQTMYGMMLKSLRKTSHKTPYFNGGRTEEIFGQQLDQVLAEKMGRRGANKIGRLSALNNLPRK